MKYEVIKRFVDLQDNNFAYNSGDTFPRDGLEVSTDRILELSTANNKRRTPLIKAVEEVEEVSEETLEEVSPVTEETLEDVQTDESTPKVAKAKKSQKKA